ncbi:hypothetical protein GEMRC1_002510 [Eukaryota sp. GEM-RC1]
MTNQSFAPPSQATFVARKTPRFTVEQRQKILEQTDYNVFNFPASMINVDLLTDSGTCAPYQSSMAALALGDESYARNNGYYVFLDALRDFTQRGDKPQKRYLSLFEGAWNFNQIEEMFTADEEERGFVNGGVAQLEHPNVYILPQGRCCEVILFSALSKYWKDQPDRVVVSNGFFDTTRANAKIADFEAVDFFRKDVFDDFPIEKVGLENPFKGDLDVVALKDYLKSNSHRVSLVVMTLTNNTISGMPVSMKNVKEVRQICDEYSIPLHVDGARIVDNAAFIKKFEDGYQDFSIPEILRQLFDLCDSFHISLKKALCNIGGVMCIKHEGNFIKKYPGINHEMKKEQIITMGNDSYGAVSGRELAACTIGLYQVVQEDYIFPRIEQTEYLAVELAKKGIPVVLPPGSHAVYLNVNKMFPERSWEDFMGIGLVSELLKQYGIRGCELGYACWELDVYYEKNGKLPEVMPPNLVRFAIPANVYSKEHMDYVVKCLDAVNQNKDNISAFEVGRGKYVDLRHFVVQYKPKNK